MNPKIRKNYENFVENEQTLIGKEYLALENIEIYESKKHLLNIIQPWLTSSQLPTWLQQLESTFPGTLERYAAYLFSDAERCLANIQQLQIESIELLFTMERQLQSYDLFLSHLSLDHIKDSAQGELAVGGTTFGNLNDLNQTMCSTLQQRTNVLRNLQSTLDTFTIS